MTHQDLEREIRNATRTVPLGRKLDERIHELIAAFERGRK